MLLTTLIILSCKHRGAETGVTPSDSAQPGADTAQPSTDTAQPDTDTAQPDTDTAQPDTGECPALWGDVSLKGLALTGPAGSETGKSLAGVGDVSGDGRAEVLLSAGAMGTVWLLSGAQTPGDLSAHATLTGPDDAARVVSGPGDVNGDGYADVLIGSRSESGNAWLLHGPLSGAIDLEGGWSGTAGDGSGLSVAGPGDLSGSGAADLLIAAPRSDQAGNDSGTIWLLEADADAGDLGAAAAATITGAVTTGYAGYSMDGAGDFDGDGHADLIVGAWGADTFAGEARVLSGPLSGSVSLADATLHLSGDNTWDVAGFSVSGAGDMTGDGYDDVLVGAYGVDSSEFSVGAAYLVAGGQSGTMSLSLATARLLGIDAGDNVGWAVSDAGDVDGDGAPDVLVGGPGLDAGATDGGGAWLLYGPLSGSRQISEAEARFVGAHAGAGTGYALAAAGDVDGDDLDDILLGAPGISAAYLITSP